MHRTCFTNSIYQLNIYHMQWPVLMASTPEGYQNSSSLSSNTVVLFGSVLKYSESSICVPSVSSTSLTDSFWAMFSFSLPVKYEHIQYANNNREAFISKIYTNGSIIVRIIVMITIEILHLFFKKKCSLCIRFIYYKKVFRIGLNTTIRKKKTFLLNTWINYDGNKTIS